MCKERASSSNKDVAMNIPSLAGSQRWRAFEWLSQWFAHKHALKLQSPPVTPLRAWENLAEQHGQRVRLNDNTSALHWPIHLGPRRGRVLLLHDWGGRATQWSGFVPLLQAQGMDVVAVDVPGHGQSTLAASQPRQSAGQVSPFVEVIRDAQQQFGPFDAMVGHGLSAHVLAHLSPTDIQFTHPTATLAQRLVLLAPVIHWSALFTATQDRSAGAEVFWSRVLAELEQSPYFRGLETKSTVGFERSESVLIVHDEHDHRNSNHERQRWAFNWPQAEILTTNGLGASKLLHSMEVQFRVVQFICQQQAVACAA
jgi:pimeloyl-ACP methyl ester carboxylesterase